MSADARIRFVVEMDNNGQLKAVQAIKGMGDQAETQGKRYGKGLAGSFQDAMQQWGKFVLAGAAVQRVWTSIADSMRKAADYAKTRQSDWDTKNGAFRSDAFRRMTAEASMRMLGVTNTGTISTVNNNLDLMRQTGRGEAAGDFNGIAASLVRRGLTGGALEKAMLDAVAGLGRRGHIAGFGDAYGALAGSKSVASGADLTDLATGMVMRGMRMSEDQAKTMRSGIGDGSISVDQQGMLTAAKDAAAEVLAAVKAVNAAGGLSVKAGATAMDFKDVLRGGINFGDNLIGAGNTHDGSRLSYAYDTKAPPDFNLDWKDPGTIQGDRPTGEAKGSDYVKAAFDSPIVQAAIAAAFMKAIDLALKSAAATVTARAAASLAAPAAAGGVGGTAARVAATGVTGGAVATAAGMASIATFVLAAKGDSAGRNLVENNVDRDARLAIKSPDFRQAMIAGAEEDRHRRRTALFPSDDKGYSEQILDRMAEILQASAAAQLKAADAQMAAATNTTAALAPSSPER